MGMEGIFERARSPADGAAVGAVRIPDLPRLLAVHAARQAAGRTARLMREGRLSFGPGDEPERMALIFADGNGSPAALRRAAGSFNARVAACSGVGTDREGEVYPQA